MKQENFFGSKLNTVLLLILILLMIGAIYLMLQNREVYLHPLQTAQADYEIYGDKTDLISFSILPGQEVSGNVNFTGQLSGGYFVKGGNITVNVVTLSQQVLERGFGTPTSDSTKDPVSFGGTIDFTKLPKGLADIRIMNDNESGLSKNDKDILIPINIE